MLERGLAPRRRSTSRASGSASAACWRSKPGHPLCESMPDAAARPPGPEGFGAAQVVAVDADGNVSAGADPRRGGAAQPSCANPVHVLSDAVDAVGCSVQQCCLFSLGEFGGDLAVGAYQAWVRAVEAVDRPVAGEHATLGAERLDRRQHDRADAVDRPCRVGARRDRRELQDDVGRRVGERRQRSRPVRDVRASRARAADRRDRARS